MNKPNLEKDKKLKGYFLPILSVVVFILIIIGIGGYLLYQKQTKQPQNSDSSIQSPFSTPSSQQTLQPSPPSSEINPVTPSIIKTTTSCEPEIGSDQSIFKVFILSNGQVSYFQNHKQQIINDLKTIQPFSSYFDKMSFYVLQIPDQQKATCQSYGIGLGGTGFVCDDEYINKHISSICGVDDSSRFTKIIITETDFGGSGGEVIVSGSNSSRDIDIDLDLAKHTAIHEIAHNMGLGDLYYGTFYYSGDPSRFYDKEVATKFPNTDIAGCPKWCKSYKKIDQYMSSECPKITSENSCRNHRREADRSCKQSECCVWDSREFEYFGQCAPAWGEENIGIDCLQDTGCYFGAVYGNDAWRPVSGDSESIMLTLSAGKFDPVSERWLSKVIKFCLSEDSTQESLNFRKEYANLITQLPGFKQRMGYCGK